MKIKVRKRIGGRCWFPFHRFKLVYSDAGTFYYQCRACKTRKMIRQGPYDGEKLDWEWIRYETENEKPFSKGIEMFSVSVDIVLERDGEEYHAYCPAFDGLHTCGKDREDAVKNARDAVEAYVKSLLKHYEPIPCCKVIDEEMIPDLKIIKKKDIVHENIEIPVSNRCL